MKVRVDYVRVTESSVLANITIQFENKDLQFQQKDGVQKAIVNIFGRITSMTRRPVNDLREPSRVDAPAEHAAEDTPQQRSIYQKSVPLAPGRTG